MPKQSLCFALPSEVVGTEALSRFQYMLHIGHMGMQRVQRGTLLKRLARRFNVFPLQRGKTSCSAMFRGQGTFMAFTGSSSSSSSDSAA